MKKQSLVGLAAALITICGAPLCEASAQATDLSQYILTPPAPETPRINGAKVFGVRPGSKFLFTIPATGKRPMTFAADGLPKGLKLDSQTGQITGTVKKAGTYNVKLTATNDLGSNERNFRIVVGEEIALTPPMGWNSWNCWGNSVSQEKVLSSARAMVNKGLINYGWTYINIDDGWQGIRGGKHKGIMPNQKFPGMKAMADEIHGMGLKVGIYSGPWVNTYAGHIGSLADDEDGTYEWIRKGKHNENYMINDPEKKITRSTFRYHGKYSFVKNDAKQWGDWDIDYLKYDWNPNDFYYTKEMADALRTLDRDVVYSLSNNAPYGDAPVWAQYTNCYRTTGDIRDTWESMSSIGFAQDKWLSFKKPGHWADPDMLVVGMVGWGPNLHNTKLTADEQYTHISLWAILAAPLLIGCDMAQLDDFTLSLLCNNEVIDVNQDPLGIQAYPYYKDNTYVTYVKHLEDGSMAVAMFNKTNEPKKIGFKPKSLGFRGKQIIRDLWRQKDLMEIEGDNLYETIVAPHGVALVKIYPGISHEKVVKEPIRL
ncbi:MAG: putative Ig domain-containing protein [Bacteroidales bacterium]|jgi:alpha-galactosidase|nr:putative Ig domain-containing protein [Bacteroidales bacterium]